MNKLFRISIFLYCFAIMPYSIFAQIHLPEQPKCGCPPVSLSVLDTKIDFPKDSFNNKELYDSIKKSGDYLDSILSVQQSDQLIINRQIVTPTKGPVYASRINNGTTDKPDFTTYAEIAKTDSNGNYFYAVSLKITDAYTNTLVVDTMRMTDSLSKLNAVLDSCVASVSPVLDSTIRNYQRKIRTSSGYAKWIGLQWQAKPDSKSLKKNKSTTVTVTVTDCLDKYPVNKLPVHISQTDANTGILSANMIQTNDSGKAAVVFTAKNKGETMMLTSFSYTSVNGKIINGGTECSNQKITVDDNDIYKITFDAENTIAEAGKDIKLHGECIASLTQLADGTYMLMPLDSTRNMKITVERAALVNAGGATGNITAPQQYTFPFLFSIDKMDKGASSSHAVVYLNTTAPQSGIVKSQITAEGKTVTTIVDIDKGSVTTIAPGYTNTYTLPKTNIYTMDAITNLNLLQGMTADLNTMKQNTDKNIAKAQDEMAWVQRMQEHENDPAYFKTAQGKADMQQMISLQQQIGGNIQNASAATKKMSADMAAKLKNNPSYAGSKQQQGDLAAMLMSRDFDKTIYQKDAAAEVAPGMGRIRIEGDFEPKSYEAFSGSLESSVGPMHTTIKIKAERTDD